MEFGRVFHEVHLAGGFTAAYRYLPLDDPAHEIRLLCLQPAWQDGVTRLSLHHVRFSDAPTYAAISYTRGAPPADEPINIDGRRLHVRKNWRHVLQRLQYHSLFKHYWIDAICINQKDDNEKDSRYRSWETSTREQIVCLLVLAAMKMTDLLFVRTCLYAQEEGHYEECSSEDA